MNSWAVVYLSGWVFFWFGIGVYYERAEEKFSIWEVILFSLAWPIVLAVLFGRIFHRILED